VRQDAGARLVQAGALLDVVTLNYCAALGLMEVGSKPDDM
jgi:hypothetical protein